MTLPRWLEDFRRTKTYDLLVGLPLLLWFARGGWQDTQILLVHLRQLRAGTEPTIGLLQMVAMAGSMLFCALLIAMLLIRTVPRARAAGVLPRVLAIIGTAIGAGFLYLNPAPLSLGLQLAAIILIITAAVLEVLAIAWLGRSFAIMAEARELVTGGPYRIVRHPLYIAEAVGMTAMLIQFFSWAAIGLYAAFLGAQAARAVIEERVLAETFPDYAAYAARTARFIPFIY